MDQEKFTGSVKVMRSYDYCHFEVQLSSSEEKTLDEIDDMRKDAARLADKAVAQYAQFKKHHSWIDGNEWDFERLGEEVKEIKKNSESEWTPVQKARVKLYDDINFRRSRDYDYADDWDDEYPEY